MCVCVCVCVRARARARVCVCVCVCDVQCTCCQSTLDRRIMFPDQEDICAGGGGLERSRGVTDGSGKMQLGTCSLIVFVAVDLLWPEGCSRQIFKKLPYFVHPGVLFPCPCPRPFSVSTIRPSKSKTCKWSGFRVKTPPMRATCHTHVILRHLMTLLIFGEQHKP